MLYSTMNKKDFESYLEEMGTDYETKWGNCTVWKTKRGVERWCEPGDIIVELDDDLIITKDGRLKYVSLVKLSKSFILKQLQNPLNKKILKNKIKNQNEIIERKKMELEQNKKEYDAAIQELKTLEGKE